MDNLIVSNILHRRARSVITICGLALGVALVMLAVGLVDGFLYAQGKRNAAVSADILFAPAAASFGFGFSSSLSATFPVETVNQLRNVEGVAEAVPLYQYLEGARMIDGIDYESFRTVSAVHVVEGRPVMTGNEVMIDRVAQRALKLMPGSELQLLGRPFKVVGIYEPESLYRFKVPLSTIQEVAHRPASCSMILVKAAGESSVEQVYHRLAERFPENKLTLTRDLPFLFARGTPAMQVFLDAVVALSITFSTILMLLTMYSTVKERTRQIGILKSMGASAHWIATEIEKEAMALSMVGVVGGFALSLVGKYVIQGIAPTPVQLEPRWFLYSTILGLLSGAIGALYPAARAAALDPVIALAYE
jgi:putative ABC transport system permease protein